VWVKISLREKCTAATFRPIGRLHGLVGACSASHSVQIARGRLLQKRSCIPTAVTGGVGGFGWESNSHAPRAKTLRTYCVPVRAALRPRVPRSAPLGCSCPVWPLRPPAARRRFSRFVLGAQQKLNAWRQRRRLRTRLPRQRAPGRPSGSGQRAAAESVSVNAGDEGGRERGNIQRAPQPHGHRSSSRLQPRPLCSLAPGRSARAGTWEG